MKRIVVTITIVTALLLSATGAMACSFPNGKFTPVAKYLSRSAPAGKFGCRPTTTVWTKVPNYKWDYDQRMFDGTYSLKADGYRKIVCLAHMGGYAVSYVFTAQRSASQCIFTAKSYRAPW